MPIQFFLIECLCSRAKNHISPEEPYFATFYYYGFSILKLNLIISLKLLARTYWNLLATEERNLFLLKLKKL